MYRPSRESCGETDTTSDPSVGAHRLLNENRFRWVIILTNKDSNTLVTYPRPDILTQGDQGPVTPISTVLVFPETQRSSGRAVKPPDRYGEYVLINFQLITLNLPVEVLEGERKKKKDK